MAVFIGSWETLQSLAVTPLLPHDSTTMGVWWRAMPCTRDHDSQLPRAIAALDDSEHGFWNHKCAGCAYEMGRGDAAVAEERLRARVRELEAIVHELESKLAAPPPLTEPVNGNARRPSR